MKFVLLEPVPAKSEWSDLALSEYLKKINPLVPIEIKTVASSKTGREQAHEKKHAEGLALLKEIKDDDAVVLFDETGKLLSSEKFAQMVQGLLNSGKKRVLWVVGGAYGVTPEVQARAQQKICLAPFVMNHLVARTVALEQIYRALSILKNLPYHNS